MSPQIPKCTQIVERTCQATRGACDNLFSFTIHSVAVTFLDVIFHLPHFVLNHHIRISLRPTFIFLSSDFPHLSTTTSTVCHVARQCRNGFFDLKSAAHSHLNKKITIFTSCHFNMLYCAWSCNAILHNTNRSSI